MPYYEYRCPANGRTLEVRHGMDECLATWGELAGRAGAETGTTPPDAPVERLMSVPVTSPGSADAGAREFAGCGRGCACVPQA
jgi:hypothetical protein